jgi:heptosyltransferase-3
MAGPVLEAIPEGKRLDQIGKLDLLTAYACLERADFYIGNDSGLMHLASAAGIPTLGLFGPSNEALYGPWGEYSDYVRGQPFAELTKGGFVFKGKTCYMNDLSIEAVEEKVADLWSSWQKRDNIDNLAEKQDR